MTTPASTDLGHGASSSNAKLAVTVFPILVIVAGVIGFLLPGALKPGAIAVPYLLGFIMFCMGLTMSTRDFAVIARNPRIVAIGFFAHYIIMPGIGWALAHLLGLPPEIAAGVILVGCAPGGTASNVVTYLARGDVAASVSVTTVSTLCAPLLTPFLAQVLAGNYMHVDASAMFGDILKTVLIPVVAGLVIKTIFKEKLSGINGALPWLSCIFISAIVAIVVAGSASKIASAGAMVFLAVVLHNSLGLSLGYLVGKACKLTTPVRRALAFEVGMQNSGLAAALATAHFSPLAALPAAVFSVWHNISGAIVAAWMARRPL